MKHDLVNLVNPDHVPWKIFLDKTWSSQPYQPGSLWHHSQPEPSHRPEQGRGRPTRQPEVWVLRFLLNIVSNTSWPPWVHAEPCFCQLVLLLSGLQSYLTFESTVHLPAPISVKGNIVGWWWQLSWPASNSIGSSCVGFNLIDWGWLSFDGETWHCYFQWPPTLASWCRQTGVYT